MSQHGLVGFGGLLVLLAARDSLAAGIGIDSPGLSGEGELGYTETAGNTDTSSLNAKLGFSYQEANWRSSLALEAVHKSDNEVSIAERYYGAAKSDYTMNPRDYVFGAVDYQRDRFSGIAHRTNLGTGYGRRVVVSEPLLFNTEFGFGYRWTQIDPGGEQADVTLRVATALAWKLSGTAGITQETTMVVGEEDAAIRAFSALTSTLVGQFSLRLSHLLNYRSTEPQGKNDYDMETAVTLVFSF